MRIVRVNRKPDRPDIVRPMIDDDSTDPVHQPRANRTLISLGVQTEVGDIQYTDGSTAVVERRFEVLCEKTVGMGVNPNRTWRRYEHDPSRLVPNFDTVGRPDTVERVEAQPLTELEKRERDRSMKPREPAGQDGSEIPYEVPSW
jgi:hypothetical protein